MSSNWWIVFAAFLCLVFMFAVPTFMIPVLYSPIIDEFGWSMTQISAGAAVWAIAPEAVPGKSVATSAVQPTQLPGPDAEISSLPATCPTVASFLNHFRFALPARRRHD